MSQPETFEVGERAICIRPGSPRYGQIVTIVEPLKRWRTWTGGRVGEGEDVIVDAYRVEPENKDESEFPYTAEPRHLRKIPPPRDDLKVVDWDQVPGWRQICKARESA